MKKYTVGFFLPPSPVLLLLMHYPPGLVSTAICYVSPCLNPPHHQMSYSYSKTVWNKNCLVPQVAVDKEKGYSALFVSNACEEQVLCGVIICLEKLWTVGIL